jgi:WD40 repeat protein
MCVLGDDRDAALMDVASGKEVTSLKGHIDYSFAAAWHPAGNVVATGNQDATTRLWDVRNPVASFATLKGRLGAVRSLSFSADGRHLMMAEPADFVHIFDVASDYEHCQEIDLFGEIAGCGFSPDGSAAFIGVSDARYASVLQFDHRRADFPTL